MLSHGFYPRITLPTRLSKSNATLIDNFLCKFTSRFYDHSSGILLSDISDHLSYFICLNSGVSRQNTSVLIEIRPSGESIDNFRKKIMDSNVATSLDHLARKK